MPPFDERDEDRLWRAVESRDVRFDGTFFTGVQTTGIYCRPVCPAKTPRRSNVRFFVHAAAAEAAGFRPCRRCRPETSPGSPAWSGTSSTVARALRLIDEGALDDAGIDDLAARLGVGGRHLRRLFDAHVGASPVAVAQTRRVHFARLLLDSSQLPISGIAAAAGFASARRFQTVFRGTFGLPASSVRRRGEAASAPLRGMSIRIPWREPYDSAGVLSFLAGRAIPGVERVEGTIWRRAIVLDGRADILEARLDSSGCGVTIALPTSPGSDLARLVARTRRVFDVDANPQRIENDLRRDSVIGASVRSRPGLRLPLVWDPFEACVRAIVGQQISVQGARTILGRIVARCGEAISPTNLSSPLAGDITHAFPTPSRLAEASLDGLGLPRARAATLREVARRVAVGEIRLDAAASFDEIEELLRSIPGIGPWTVKYVRMRGLGDPDVFLEEDLGVRRALERGRGKAPSPREAAERARSWSPWRSYAVLHLWAGDGSKEEERTARLPRKKGPTK